MHEHDIFTCIFLNENLYVLIEIALRLIYNCSIDNQSSLVQVMAWHHIGAKPLPETTDCPIHWHINTSHGLNVLMLSLLAQRHLLSVFSSLIHLVHQCMQLITCMCKTMTIHMSMLHAYCSLYINKLTIIHNFCIHRKLYIVNRACCIKDFSLDQLPKLCMHHFDLVTKILESFAQTYLPTW